MHQGGGAPAKMRSLHAILYPPVLRRLNPASRAPGTRFISYSKLVTVHAGRSRCLVLLQACCMSRLYRSQCYG